MTIVFGGVLAIVDLATFLLGAYLAVSGIKSPGDGKIDVIIEKVGQILNVNGQLAVTIIGASLVLLSVIYAFKAYKTATSRPPQGGGAVGRAVTGSTGLGDIVRGFAP